MAGIPDHNYPAFRRAASFLRAQGHEVYSPAEYWTGHLDVFPLRQVADFSAHICLVADTIALLPGWGRSKGVAAELALAKACGLDVLHLMGDEF
jgi:hypothetical protein